MTPRDLRVRGERVVAERDHRGWLVMYADGTVEWLPSKRAVLAAVKARRGDADALVTELEWRSPDDA